MTTSVQQGSTSHTNEPWAKLISIQPDLENQILFKTSYTVGTSPSNDIKISNNLLQGDLFKIEKKSDGCWIQNLSTEIYLGDESLEAGETKQIFAGDKIHLLNPGGPGYIITEASTNGNSILKRKREQETHTVNSDMNVEKQTKNAGNDDEELMCGICSDYIFQCGTCIPCLHNFCGSCLSEWVIKSTKCQKCNQEIVEVKMNVHMIKKVKKFLQENPIKQRPGNERTMMNNKNKFNNNEVLLKDFLDAITKPAKTQPPSKKKFPKETTPRLVTKPQKMTAMKTGRKSAFWYEPGHDEEDYDHEDEDEDLDEESEESGEPNQIKEEQLSAPSGEEKNKQEEKEVKTEEVVEVKTEEKIEKI